DTEDGRERVQAAGAALAVEPRTSSEAEVQGRGGVTRGLLDVVAVLRDFTDFSAVVARGAGVAVEFSGAARESGGAHAAFGVEAVDAVDVELFTDGTADEVLDRDAARDAERVLFERGDAFFEGRDGGVLLGVAGFEGRDAVTE